MPFKDISKEAGQKFSIMLEGKRREDGTLFVTSTNLPYFSAVLHCGVWEEVLVYLKMFLEKNVGKVKSINIIHDASELMSIDKEREATPPPAYVLAEVSKKHVGAMRTRTQ